MSKDRVYPRGGGDDAAGSDMPVRGAESRVAARHAGAVCEAENRAASCECAVGGEKRMQASVLHDGGEQGTPGNVGIRVVEAAQLIPEALAIIAEGVRFPLVVSGSSMEPFLHPGRDSVILSAVGERRVRRGDILLFGRGDGSFVLHRVHRVDSRGVWFIGDAQSFIEGPIPRERLFAFVGCVIRGGKTITRHSPTWAFYSFRRVLKTVRQRLRGSLVSVGGAIKK